MAFVGMRFQMGSCVLTEFDPDGFLTVQPDGLGEKPRIGTYELHHPFGFASRPIDPDVGPSGEILEGKACNLLFAGSGDEAHAWLAGDPRYIDTFPPLAKGSSVQYAGSPAPSFDMHNGENGTKTIYVEVGDSAHVVTIGVDGNGDSILELAHSQGMRITLLKQGIVIANAAGDAYVEVNAGGINLNGNVMVTGALAVGAASLPLAKSAELLAWAALVNSALSSAGFPILPLSTSVATTLTKGT